MTLEHLLSHASGMTMGERSITRPPGTRRIYSNAGIEAAADMLEEATGTEIGRWIEETIAEPLGLTSLTVEGSPAYSGLCPRGRPHALCSRAISPDADQC